MRDHELTRAGCNLSKNIKQHLETNNEFFCHAKRQNTVTTYFTIIHE